MNATTDLLYPTLINLPRTFDSRDYRREIERLSLEELDKHIESLSSSLLANDINSREKLRLCLRFRNAYLINLPYFEVTKINEWFSGRSHQIEKDIVVFYFLNFKDNNDIEIFKANTANTANNKEVISILIMKENSFGFEEMKNYSKCLGRLSNFILEINSFQYNHLISRNRLQDILFKYCTDSPIAPCNGPHEVIMTLQKSRNFTVSRYPENKDDHNFNLNTTVNLLLKRMNILDKENLAIVLLIELNPVIDSQFKNDLMSGNQDWHLFNDLFNRMVFNGEALFSIMINDKIDCRMRVSIIGSEIVQTGKSEVEIERAKTIERINKILQSN